MDKKVYDQLVKTRHHLWWWVGDKENLSEESVVQGVLAYGDMNDVKLLLQMIGKERVKEIFLTQISRPRHNYRPQTVHFFAKVFSQDV